MLTGVELACSRQEITIHLIFKSSFKKTWIAYRLLGRTFFSYQYWRKIIVCTVCTIQWRHFYGKNFFASDENTNFAMRIAYLLEAGAGFTAPCGGWRHLKDGQKEHQDTSQPHLSPLSVSFVKKLSSQAMNSVRGFSSAVLADFAPGEPVYTTRCRPTASCSAAIVLPLTTKQCTHRTASWVLLNCESFAS